MNYSTQKVILYYNILLLNEIHCIFGKNTLNN